MEYRTNQAGVLGPAEEDPRDPVTGFLHAHKATDARVGMEVLRHVFECKTLEALGATIRHLFDLNAMGPGDTMVRKRLLDSFEFCLVCGSSADGRECTCTNDD